MFLIGSGHVNEILDLLLVGGQQISWFYVALGFGTHNQTKGGTNSREKHAVDEIAFSCLSMLDGLSGASEEDETNPKTKVAV